MIAASISFLWRKNFLDFTARSAATSKRETTELITAFIVAKMCGLKPNLIFNLTLDKRATAVNTIIETAHINIRAFLSLRFKSGAGNFSL